MWFTKYYTTCLDDLDCVYLSSIETLIIEYVFVHMAIYLLISDHCTVAFINFA